MEKADIPQAIYDSEIGLGIESDTWDGGFRWRLGDPANGYKESGGADTWDEAVQAVATAAVAHFPRSVFAYRYRDGLSVADAVASLVNRG